MITITLNSATGQPISTILSPTGEDAIVKGLRLLQLVGTMEQMKEAADVLHLLGEPIHQRPN